jgi:hypothetical protein
MDIELTSLRDEETFTWRAAGAREPRGVIAKTLLSPEARPGDVLRVEADLNLDGIVIRSVIPAKTSSPRPQNIEIHSPRPVEGGVTTSLVEKSQRRGRGRDGGDRSERRERPSRGERPTRTGGGTRAAEGGERRGGARPTGERRPPRTDAPQGERPQGERPTRSDRPAQSGRPPQDATRPRRSRPARLVPGTKHRDALFATLPPEQLPIAEQLAAGGLPAVRRALEQQRQTDRAEGRPGATGEAIVSLAEQILPAVREATWLDRAEAVSGQLEVVSLRDLRSTVVGAAPHDEVGRDLLRSLRASLDERLTKLRTTWEEEMAHALEGNRVLQALRLSAKPPEPTARFPAALVQPLADAAGAALSATTPADRYLQLLEAAAASPIRRSIKPTGLPVDPDGSVRKAATLAAGRVPALAPLLGLTMPPPPGPMPTIAPRRVPRPPPPSTPKVAAVVDAPPSDVPTDNVAADATPTEVVETTAPSEAPAALESPADVAETAATEQPVIDSPVTEDVVIGEPATEDVATEDVATEAKPAAVESEEAAVTEVGAETGEDSQPTS